MINWLALFERCRFATMWRPSGGNAVGCTHDWILPPLRGSNVNIAFSVGYVRIAHVTNSWGPYAAMRLSVAFRAESLCDD